MVTSRLFGVLASVILIVGCSSDQKEDEKKAVQEQFPKINKADYSIEKSESGYSLMIPKYMFATSGRYSKSDLEFNHTSKERHVYVEVAPVHQYKKSVDSRALIAGKQKGLFQLFVEEQLKDFKASRTIKSSSELKESRFEKISNYSIELDAKEYGFPKDKTYFIRWKAFKKRFYTIVCWTTKDQKEKFSTEAKAIGLSLKQ